MTILTYESPMQSYMTAERKSGSTVEFKGEKSVSIVFLESWTDFRCILHSVCLQKRKVYVLYFKTSPYQKILATNYLQYITVFKVGDKSLTWNITFSSF